MSLYPVSRAHYSGAGGGDSTVRTSQAASAVRVDPRAAAWHEAGATFEDSLLAEFAGAAVS